MKQIKILAVLLVAVLLLAGCQSQVQYSENTVLIYRLKDMDVRVQMEPEDAKLVANILNGQKIERWMDWDTLTLRYYAYGCPYDQNVCIEIDGAVYYIASDGCGTVRIGNSGEDPHIQLSYEEEQRRKLKAEEKNKTKEQKALDKEQNE